MSAAIEIPAESRGVAKGEASLIGGAPSSRNFNGKGGYKKGIAIFDFILRFGAAITALSAAGVMGTSDQTLPFVSQFFRFEAGYDDLPTLRFFVIAMALVGGYLVLSLPFSIVAIVRPRAVGPRLLLLILDSVALALNTSAASAAAAIVYLAHNGNQTANWLGVCQQFTDFCQNVSGAVVGSFVSVVLFMLMIVMSALSLF